MSAGKDIRHATSRSDHMPSLPSSRALGGTFDASIRVKTGHLRAPRRGASVPRSYVWFRAARMMVFTSSAWTTSQCTFSGRSSSSQDEIGGSPATGGRSSPQQIHEEAVRQHNNQNAGRDEGGADERRCTLGPRGRIADFHVATYDGFAGSIQLRYRRPNFAVTHNRAFCVC